MSAITSYCDSPRNAQDHMDRRSICAGVPHASPSQDQPLAPPPPLASSDHSRPCPARVATVSVRGSSSRSQLSSIYPLTPMDAIFSAAKSSPFPPAVRHMNRRGSLHHCRIDGLSVSQLLLSRRTGMEQSKTPNSGTRLFASAAPSRAWRAAHPLRPGHSGPLSSHPRLKRRGPS